MPLTNEEPDSIQNCLEKNYLHMSACMPGKSHAQIREYIDASEYGLAFG